jgi:hypothetical protein
VHAPDKSVGLVFLNENVNRAKTMATDVEETDEDGIHSV